MPEPRLVVAYGSDRRRLAREVLAALAVEHVLPRGGTIGLKPNLVVAKPSSSGATTDPELAAGVMSYLRDHGWRDFVILEGSWLGTDTAEAFRVCGYVDLAREFGARLVDLKKDETDRVEAGGLQLEICRTARQVDALIDLPVLKAHGQTKLTCALKNLKGCLPDREKRRFHALGLDKPIAALAKALPVALVVVDAVQGDLTFEEGGNPTLMERVIAGFDPVLIDAYGARLIGYEPEEIAYLPLAAALGAGCLDLDASPVLELGKPSRPLSPLSSGRLAVALGRRVEQREACSACYAAILHALARLDEAGTGLPDRPIRVGQGFRDRNGDGPGIGRCARGFLPHLDGCPPSAAAVAAFLKGLA